jgi:predicted deacylase
VAPPPARDPSLPPLEVRLAPPDLAPWLRGGALPGVHLVQGMAPGPNLALVALVHGNEYAGAVLLDRWLRSGFRPARGRLTLVLANLEAFARFDAEDPTQSRFVDEDLNRVWSPETLQGPRRSCELRRARELLPAVEAADALLDLHSMLWQPAPLIIAGRAAKAARLGLAIGTPELVLADEGHPNGARLIDYPRFVAAEDPRVALLVEAGLHWEAETVRVMEACAMGLMRRLDMLDPAPARAGGRLAQVTRTVVAASHRFAFTGAWRGGEVVPAKDTLIAMDGDAEIRTPHDDCLVVMPSLRAMRGHTAVRLARFVGTEAPAG